MPSVTDATQRRDEGDFLTRLRGAVERFGHGRGLLSRDITLHRVVGPARPQEAPSLIASQPAAAGGCPPSVHPAQTGQESKEHPRTTHGPVVHEARRSSLTSLVSSRTAGDPACPPSLPLRRPLEPTISSS